MPPTTILFPVDPRPDRDIARRGLAAARQALAGARLRAAERDARQLDQAREARAALARATTRSTSR